MGITGRTSGIPLILVFIAIISVQSFDSGEDDDFINDKDGTRMVLTQEESDLYDRDKDGTLNHKEMERYLQDVLARKKAEPTDKKNVNAIPWLLLKLFEAFTLKIVAISLALCILSIGVLYQVLFKSKPKTHIQGVQVEDIRAARLRKLQQIEPKPKNQLSHKDSSIISSEPNVKKRHARDSTSEEDLDDFEMKYHHTRKHCNAETSKETTGVKQRPFDPAKQQDNSTSNSDKTEKIHDVASKAATQALDDSFGSTIKEASFDKVVEMILSKVLDCQFEMWSASSKTTYSKTSDKMSIPLSSNATTINVVLQAEDIPTNMEEIKKVSKIVSKRLCLDLEPMKSAIKCFDRCIQIMDPDFKDRVDIWHAVTSIVKLDSADKVLQELVKAIASPTSVEEDLWSDLYNSSNCQGLSLYFLNCLAGWSSDGAVVSSELLKVIIEKAKDDSIAKDMFVDMIALLGRHVQSLSRRDEIALECCSLFKGLEVLINQPLMVEFMSDEFMKEIHNSSMRLGNFYHEKSIFSAFLSLTTLEAKVTGKSQASKPFLNLPNFPRAAPSDMERIQSQLQDGLHSCQTVVYSIVRKTLAKHPQSVLAWIAAVVTDNDIRSKVLLSENPDKAIACDGFMMNFCHVLLRLCEPFFVSKGETKIADIATGYCLSDACRLNHNNERTLTGFCIEREERGNSTNFILPDELQGKFVLKSEVFHITQRALHIGLVNTIQHHNRLLRQYLVLKEMNEGKEQEYVQKILALFIFQWRTVIEDEEFMRLCCEFYLTSALWLSKALESCEQSQNNQQPADDVLKENQKSLLVSGIPEFYVKDMCTWFYYVATNSPQSLRGLKIIYFVDCCAMIMSSKVFVPGPMVSSKVVTALLSFADSCTRNKIKDSLLETASWGSGVEGCLTAAVVVSPVTREKLASALIQTYTSVDVVEGLDVDKEEFDKFTSRYEVIKLLQFLWNYPESRDVLKKKCKNYEVNGFLTALLDSLLYLLNDGLSRLTNVSKLQKSIEDESKWDEMDLTEQQQKTNFLKNEEHVSKSFMSMANTTLTFLALITQEHEVARCFCLHPLSQRAASAIIGFLDSLCGPRRFDLKVKNMDKYSFNPRDLLGKLASVLCCIASSDEKEDGRFVRDIASDPDFSKPIVEQALKTLTRHNLVSPENLAELEVFITRCEVNGELSRDNMSCDHAQPDKADQHDDEELESLYEERFRDERHGICPLQEVTAFQCCRSQPINQRSSKIRALMREITQLKDSLPIHVNSSIFVRQDEERMDFVRILITGPVDTPYSRGCFVFDVYFPSNYPNVPPLVKLITTGNGTVRFNPNLYADGKVCLSLLGTWHGGDSSEKWNPKTSSLYQVLLSIQGMILIPDPCFNEPGYESIRGTNDGNELSRKYNATIRLATIRHAMLAQIRLPPAGFEDIIRDHFRLQKKCILRQVYEWLQQCREPDEERRMLRDIEELKVELNKL